nr:SDR family oxidoreductase [Neisseria musculi]
MVIVGRSEHTLQESAGRHANIGYIVGDVSNSADIARILADIQAKFGRLDIVVNNAGIAPVTPLKISVSKISTAHST